MFRALVLFLKRPSDDLGRTWGIDGECTENEFEQVSWHPTQFIPLFIMIMFEFQLDTINRNRYGDEFKYFAIQMKKALRENKPKDDNRDEPEDVEDPVDPENQHYRDNQDENLD